jgi:hypothetical protein
MIEPRLVFYDADQLFFPIVKSDVSDAPRHDECISGSPNTFLSVDPRPDFSPLHVKNLILANMNVLERDIASGVDCPFHGENFRRG